MKTKPLIKYYKDLNDADHVFIVKKYKNDDEYKIHVVLREGTFDYSTSERGLKRLSTHSGIVEIQEQEAVLHPLLDKLI